MTGVARGLLRIIVDGKVEQLVRTEKNGKGHYIQVRINGGEVKRVYQDDFEPIVRKKYPDRKVELKYR